MKAKLKKSYLVLALFSTGILVSAFVRGTSAEQKLAMPYKKAGLSEQQAAAHLLSRFTYGAQPGQVDEVVKIGLDKWFKQQLDGELPDEELNQMLNNYDALKLSNTEIENTFPRNPTVKRLAIKEGYLNKDSVSTNNRKYEREAINAYMKAKGFRPEQELYRQFFSQKILRAAYSNNQLREVLTEFWFNHFNVAVVKPACANFIPAYERDVIRPNVFGDFEDLLIKTAKSPAMLVYLDNFTSTGNNMPLDYHRADEMIAVQKNPAQRKKMMDRMNKLKEQANQKKGKSGLNENYAREVMELHTLGVDGGYTQNDVTQAARVLTGWTLAPMGEYGAGNANRSAIERIGKDKLEEKGFVFDGDFLFAMNRHDNGEKIVLGHKFPAGGGYEEGIILLKMLAHHPSTSKFIAKKLAVRFVSDNPPASLIDKMAKTFSSSNGNIKNVLITMVNAPEFWSQKSLREKTKSPFELAMSAVRGVDAKINQPYQLYSWINKMGQQMYYYQAPTGFPDYGQYWINTGSLLNRMNFGLAFASQRIPGIKIDLAALNHNREPESTTAALKTYGQLLLPERDLSQTLNRLSPMLNDNNLQQKVYNAAAKNDLSKPMSAEEEQTSMQATKEKNNKKNLNNPQVVARNGDNSMLAQVVGVLIGSPEFQRR